MTTSERPVSRSTAAPSESRPTVRDVARVAGVSPAAVSFALNDKPGVAEPTRRRILAVAAELGWVPGNHERGPSTARAAAIGMAIVRELADRGADRFYFGFLMGLQGVMQRHGLALVTQLVTSVEEESRLYRRWRSQRRVDGVVMLEPRLSDPRVNALLELEMPAVSVGSPVNGLGAVFLDERAGMAEVIDHLADNGYRRIAYIGGSLQTSRVYRHLEALADQATRRGVQMISTRCTSTAETAGRAEVERLLSQPDQPDAIIFDTVTLALGGIAALQAGGLRLGVDVGVVSNEESPWCRLSVPGITATSASAEEIGRIAGFALIEQTNGGTPRHHERPPIQLLRRGSTSRC